MLVVARLAPDASKLASSNQTEAPRRVTEKEENKEGETRNRRFVGDVTPQVEFRRPRRISGVALNFWFSIPSTGALKGSSLSALKEKTSGRGIKLLKLSPGFQRNNLALHLTQFYRQALLRQIMKALHENRMCFFKLNISLGPVQLVYFIFSQMK